MRSSIALPSLHSAIHSIKKLTLRFPGLSKALLMIVSYVGWTLIFRILSLTFITYFVMSEGVGSGGGADVSKLEEVNEALATSQSVMSALSALGFIFILDLFYKQYQILTGNPSHTKIEFFSAQRFEKQFTPGFLHGAVLAAGVALAFLLSGIYRYLGFFVQTDNAPMAAASLVLRSISFIVFVYCEEYIFRHWIFKKLSITLHPLRSRYPLNEFWSSMSAVVLSGVFYVCLKLLQFDLGWMQALTLLLISVSLGMRALATGDFIQGAGFWAAILIVFQVLLSLPVFGQDFSGLFLLKYQAAALPSATNLKEFWPTDSSSGETLRWITGGAGGPLASLAFQILLILDLTRAFRRFQKRFRSS